MRSSDELAAMPQAFGERYSRVMLTAARLAVLVAAAAVPFSTSATNIAFALAFGAWLCSGRFFAMLQVAALHPVARGAAVLLALAIAGTLWSSASVAESAEALGKYRKLLLLVMLLPLLDSPYWRRAVLVSLFGSLAMLLLISIAVHVGLAGMPTRDPLQGAIVTRHHITHGFLMALLAVGAVVLAATAQSSAGRWAAATVAVSAVANSLIMTHSRTGYLIFAALLISAATYRFRWKGLLTATMAATLFGLLAYHASPAVQMRVDAAVSEVRGYHRGDVVTSTGIRLHFYYRALDIVFDYPWVGAGTGAWPTEYERRSATDPPELRRVSGMGNPHNEYLLTAVQWGALGLTLHLVALVGLFKLAGCLPLRRALIARGTLVVFAVGSLFNSFFWDTTEGHTLVLLLGAVYGGNWRPDSADI
jgi:O-antigen ligase